jgi:hypothetical protein
MRRSAHWVCLWVDAKFKVLQTLHPEGWSQKHGDSYFQEIARWDILAISCTEDVQTDDTQQAGNAYDCVGLLLHQFAEESLHDKNRITRLNLFFVCVNA